MVPNPEDISQNVPPVITRDAQFTCCCRISGRVSDTFRRRLNTEHLSWAPERIWFPLTGLPMCWHGGSLHLLANEKDFPKAVLVAVGKVQQSHVPPQFPSTLIWLAGVVAQVRDLRMHRKLRRALHTSPTCDDKDHYQNCGKTSVCHRGWTEMFPEVVKCL